MPNPWHRSPKSRSAKDHPDNSTTAAQGWLGRTKHAVNVILRRKPVNAGGEDDMKNDTSEDWKYHGGKPTSVREVWFAGCHADVGGGSTPNNRTHALANPSLQWMVSEVLKYAPDVLFRLDAFTHDNAFLTSKEIRDGEEVLYKVEQKDPVQDANAKKNDMLVKKPVWLILEYIPTFQYYQNREGDWKWRFRWNNRRPRKIYDGKPLLHASVKLRRDYENKWRTKFVPEDGNDLEFEYVD
ncbi:hypothetical protein FRC00_009860 [Tulasnella sp. 408]|nr:hypothetical protein FRC00_009860 [Tulasnella sp. 408]